jgi:hypothetical protein
VVTAIDPVANYSEIASGADCVLTEVGTGGAISWQILDAAGDPVVGGAFSVVIDPTILDPDDQVQPPLIVENTFRFAQVSVSKVVAPDPQRSDFGPFEFTISCTLDGREVLPEEATVQSIGARETFTWTELAEGADCTITETGPGAALRIDHTMTMANGAQSAPVNGNTVTLAALRGLSDQPNGATFINWYALPNTGGNLGSTAALAAAGGLILLIGAGLLGFATIRRSRRATEATD